MSTAAILLATQVDAAGAARALGRVEGEANLTLVEHAVAEILRTGTRDIVVVVGPDADRVIALISSDNVDPIIDTQFAASDAHALRVGASAVPRGTDVAILTSLTHPASTATYAELLDARAAQPASVVRIEGLPWPAIVDANALADLRNLPDGGATLDAFFARHADNTITLPFGGVRQTAAGSGSNRWNNSLLSKRPRGVSRNRVVSRSRTPYSVNSRIVSP